MEKWIHENIANAYLLFVFGETSSNFNCKWIIEYIFVVGLGKTIENRKEKIFTLVLFCDGAYLYVISCVPVNAFVCSLQEPSRAWIDWQKWINIDYTFGE